MKRIILFFVTILWYSFSIASTTISFTRADGLIVSTEFSTEGVSEIINGYILNNCLEQSNIDAPGSITITFATNQSVVRIDYIRNANYSLDNNTLGVDYTTLAAYDGPSGSGNIISSSSFLSSNQFEVVGNNSIKSIKIIGTYDNFGHFNAFDNLFFDENPEALPVELTSFSAQINNNNVKLSWETSTEVNNYGFEIEKQNVTQIASTSVDEIKMSNKAWENIGFVNGHGNSNSPKLYSYSDKLALYYVTIEYRLKQIDLDGSFKYSKVISITAPKLMSEFKLEQNYPNPFNPNTIISYSIPDQNGISNDLSLRIYDQLGSIVESLNIKEPKQGKHEFLFDGKNLSSGVYFYSIQYGEMIKTNKMILTK